MGEGNKWDPDRLDCVNPIPQQCGGLGVYERGNVDLVNGVATVLTPLADVPGACDIHLTIQNINSGTPGFLYIENRVVGVSFEIRSFGGVLDNSTVAWLLIVP